MLPPRDLNSKCLRCGAALAADAQTCGACGADRDVEREIHGELVPALAQLRVILAIVAVASAVTAAVVYDHARSHRLDGVTYAWPQAAAALIFAALWLLAPRAPLATAIVGMCVVLGNWAQEAIASPIAAVSPGVTLVLRILLVAALAVAIRAALTARRIRARTRIPQAIVR